MTAESVTARHVPSYEGSASDACPEATPKGSGLHRIIGDRHREYSWRCFADARSDKISVISRPAGPK
jgi:hypothetical protein